MHNPVFTVKIRNNKHEIESTETTVPCQTLWRHIKLASITRTWHKLYNSKITKTFVPDSCLRAKLEGKCLSMSLKSWA